MKSKENIKNFTKFKKDEITKEISHRQSKLYDLYSDTQKGKIKNVREAKKIKKEIAQLKTILVGMQNER